MIEKNDSTESKDIIMQNEIESSEALSDEEQLLLEREARRIRSQKMRKKALPILLGALVALIVIPLALVLIFQALQKNDNGTDPTFKTYRFYEPYEGNILEYDVYLNLDRQIKYYDNINEMGLMEIVGVDTTDDKLIFIQDFFQAVIRGDASSYNLFFDDVYYQSHDRVSHFAQQMIYDIHVRLDRSEDIAGGDKLIRYELEYKIHKNNGTYRTDIGSDGEGTRVQYIVLRVSQDGSISIRDLYLKTYRTQ